ncbi:uncharacterized protein LOC129717382 [Wyeomyia smithii]|uniref:uncharacterized protein LOC129717382 n=1 Tax=Wyeomyia smithii TaxID=174621 RepID=UPI0024681792|nr:uncharacterized protein LOC129717382 [Wyeomyia smithii]
MVHNIWQLIAGTRESFQALFELRKDTDYFYLLKPFEVVIGYNMQSWTRRQRFGWALMVTIFLLYFLHLSWKVLSAFVVEGSFGYFTGTVCLWVICAGALTQICIFRNTRKHQDVVRAFINGRQNQTKDRHRSWDKRAKSFRFNVWFTLICIASIAFNGTCFALIGGHRKPEFTIVIDLGSDYESLSGFIQKASSTFFIIFGVTEVLNIVWITSFFNAMVTELEILVEIFDELGSDGDGASLDELVVAIGKQQQYLDCVRHLQYLTSPSFLVQYYPTQAVIALVILQFTYYRGTGLGYAYVAHAIFLSWLYWYMCNYVEILESKCIQIGEIIYNQPWYSKQHRALFRSYSLIIARSQHGLQFRCGGIFLMSMESFADLLRKSSSLLMFMMTFK